MFFTGRLSSTCTLQHSCFTSIPCRSCYSKPIWSREYIILIQVHSPNPNTQTTAHNDSVSTQDTSRLTLFRARMSFTMEHPSLPESSVQVNYSVSLTRLRCFQEWRQRWSLQSSRYSRSSSISNTGTAQDLPSTRPGPCSRGLRQCGVYTASAARL